MFVTELIPAVKVSVKEMKQVDEFVSVQVLHLF
jgi:hypothetical protein